MHHALHARDIYFHASSVRHSLYFSICTNIGSRIDSFVIGTMQAIGALMIGAEKSKFAETDLEYMKRNACSAKYGSLSTLARVNFLA